MSERGGVSGPSQSMQPYQLMGIQRKLARGQDQPKAQASQVKCTCDSSTCTLKPQRCVTSPSLGPQIILQVGMSNLQAASVSTAQQQTLLGI